ncbi:type II and III secretion system protein family protein [Novispirillum sp. DQ9]|uniref:type II and III secretion system protein family protein n=1 Tax=Novispirillum sp. DQ9 TaxID=3398612 RepID=UPI003C7A0A39
MTTRLHHALLAVALTLAPLLPAQAAPDMDIIETAPVRVREDRAATMSLRGDVGPATPLEMAVGRTMAVPLSAPVSDVIVANPSVVDVLVQGPRQVYVLGRGPGATNVFFIGRDGNVVLNAEILVSADLTAAKIVLARLLPDANIDLRAVGQSVIMSGTVHSAREAADAQAVVEQFLGVGVAGSLQATERTSRQPGGGAGGQTDEAAAAGAAAGTAMREAFQGIEGRAANRPSGEAKVINALRVIGDQQVLLQVKVAEVQRTTLKALSVNFLANNGSFSNLPFPAGEPFVRAMTGALSTVGVDNMAFDALERQGLIKVLAEPTLTAISGETANFLAGGLLPVPSDVDDEGNVRVTFREFGVSLSFTPVVLANNQLSLRIATEVSRVSSENALPFVLRGTGREVEIKGLSVRRADSTVTVPSGGSLMIAGMLQNDEINSFDGVPGLMDLPIIGALFRSQEFRTQRTELVVVVQAFRVRPIEFAKGLSLPTDGFVPASDLDIYLLGRLHARYGGTVRGEALTLAGPVGYILE